MAEHLAANPENEVLFASCHQRRGATVPGVRRIILRTEAARRSPQEENCAQAWCRATLSGKGGYAFLQRINAEFQPHWVLSSASRGATFFVQRAFPQAFHVFYAGVGETNPQPADLAEDKKAELDMQCVQILQSRLCFVFSARQRAFFPPAIRANLRCATPWVDTDWMCPDSTAVLRCEELEHVPGQELVSFDVRHFAAALAKDLRDLFVGLLAARPSCRVLVCFGGNPMRKLFEAWRPHLPDAMRRRLHLANFLPLAEYRNMFRVTRLHVCADAAPSPLPGCLEAMSCGAALMLPAPPASFVSLASGAAFLKPGENMLPLPQNGPQEQLAAVLRALDRPDRLADLGFAARRSVVAAYSPQKLVPPHVETVLAEYERFRQGQRGDLA